MSRRTAITMAIVTATASVGVLAAGSPATAALVTHCIGTGGAVTVPNDLLVPAGESCALTGTTVTGNITVQAGANLVVTGGSFSGEVRVSRDGYLDASDTTIGGVVVLAAGGYGAYLRDATSGSITVRPKGTTTVDSFLFVDGTTVGGSVNAQAGEVRLDKNTQVEGGVSTTGTYYTDVNDSFVDGALSVLNTSTGSVVCGSSIRGKSTFAGNLGGVQLGPNGPLNSCASGGFFGKDVSVTSTTGGVTVDDNIIDGKLTATGNTPVATIADTNRIRGGVTTDPASAAAARSARQAAPAPRDDDATEDRAADRRIDAVADAKEAGAAKL